MGELSSLTTLLILIAILEASARPLVVVFTTLMGATEDIMPNLHTAYFRSGAVDITIMARMTMTDI